MAPGPPRMAATLDGRVQGSDAVFEAKFMLPWSFSEEGAAEKHMPQHNMWVVAARTSVTAERKFWRCVESGEPPRFFGTRDRHVRYVTRMSCLICVSISDVVDNNGRTKRAAT